MIHELKTKPQFFEALAAGVKNFEVRKHDRPYSVGDYVASNEWGDEGYVVLGLEPCAIRTRGKLMEPIHYENGAPVYERK